MKVTVYTKSNCVQCEATKRWLRKGKIEFDTVNLEESPEAMAKIQEMGYSAAPVVITDVDSWSGFRISKLENLKAELRSEEVHKSNETRNRD